MQQRRTSLLIPLATAAGLAFIAGVMLVATQANSDPVGRHYDAYNRVLTGDLILLLVCSVWIAREIKHRSLAGTTATRAIAGGFGLMVAGNVVEFWGALVTGSETEKTAARLGHEDAFWGSGVGWILFLLGSVVATVALIIVARAAGRWGATSSQRWAIGAAGVMQAAASALWAAAPIAAAIPAAAFAFGWLSLATAVQRADEHATTQVGSSAATTARA
ncbi:MAG: hypothetical protein GEU71_14715 [Actinobacteria bacterium]|jgi:hypothetical protein|nr:hypothetical protein [Actinomycetota bacterium]